MEREDLKEGNDTYGSCAYYNMSDGGKKVSEYFFDFGNVSALTYYQTQ